MRRRRRRTNPASAWISIRTVAGLAAGIVGAAIVETRRAERACDDGAKAFLSCQDATSLAVLVGAPIAIGMGTQGARLEPGTIRSGVALAGIVLGAAVLVDGLRGSGIVAKWLGTSREPPAIPQDVVTT